MPAYVAYERGYWSELGIDVAITVEATAWLIPDRLLSEEQGFAVMPWTRVAAASVQSEPLVLVCGSGCDEAAIVVRCGLRSEHVRRVAVPQQGGIKDLTAAAAFSALGWKSVETLRFPSGDAAIMVEPYATLVEQLGLGEVILRTGDIWSGVPGCSLTTTARMIDRDPDLVRRMVAGFVRGAREVEDDPETSAKIASPYIGVAANVIQRALHHNHPDVSALDNDAAMARVVRLMVDLGYLSETPSRPYKDLTFLREACSMGQRGSRLTATHGGK